MSPTPVPSRPSTRRLVTAVAVGACLTAGAGLADPAGAQQPAAQQLVTRRLEATLRPSGDPNGSGEAVLRLTRAAGRVCARIEWHRIGAPQAAHVHRRSDGGVVVDLSGAVTGGARCTTGVAPALIGRILAHPRRYYVNVHNARYAAGAVQGTLHR